MSDDQADSGVAKSLGHVSLPSCASGSIFGTPVHKKADKLCTFTSQTLNVIDNRFHILLESRGAIRVEGVDQRIGALR